MKDLRELTVLYVESDPLARDDMSSFLKTAVKAVHTASSAADGIEIFRLQKADIVIDSSGSAGLAHAVRQSGESAPVIVILGGHALESLVPAMDSGADQLLIKPVSHEDVLKTLVNCAAIIRDGNPGGGRHAV